MRLFRSLFLLALAVLPAAAQQPRPAAPAAAKLTTPKQAMGFEIGADYNLATYTQLTKYWQILAKQSDRMILDTIGLTAEGRPHLAAIISSPANLARREEYRKMAEALARGRIDSATARRYAQTGKSIMWIDGGLHANEVLGAAQLQEVVWQFVSRNDPETMRILNDVIIVVVHANPDGMELVSSWYMRNPDSLRRNSGSLPRLYEKYAGHDNNRDFYRNALPESQNMSKFMYMTWYPQIMYNHHQTGPNGAVMFAPPFRDPFNYFFDPIVPTSLEVAGMMLQRRFAVENKGGVVSREASNYSTWWNGGLRTTAYFHNMIGILTETIGDPNPGNASLSLNFQLPSANGYLPVQWGPWHFKQSVDYSMTANRALLDWASRDRENLLFNFWRMGRNGIERGQKDTWTNVPRMMDSARTAGQGLQGQAAQAAYAAVLRDPNRRDPRAFVIRADQPEIGNALTFLQALAVSGIEIHKATAAFSLAGKSYPKGSFIVKSDQAFRAHVLDMFERQDHPTDLQYPGGPPKAPYDNAGYTLAFQMGFQFDRVLDAYTAPAMTQLPLGTVTPDPAPFQAQSAGWKLTPKSTETFLAVNRLLKANVAVTRNFNGEFLVPAGAAASKILGDMARERGYRTEAVGSVAGGVAVQPLRVALVDQYGGSMPVGWTRYVLEQFEVPFDIVYPSQIDEGKLSSYGVLILNGVSVPGVGGGGGRGAGGGAPAAGAANAGGRGGAGGGRGGAAGAGAAGAAGAGGAAPAGGRGGGGGGLGIPDSLLYQVARISVDNTLPKIKAFMEAGGQVLAVGSAATSMAQQLGLPLENHLTRNGAAISRNEYYIPGSILQATVDTTLSVAAGALPLTDVFFDNSPVWKFGAGADTKGMKKVAWYATTNVLRSGWAEGPEFLKDGVAIASAPVGKGMLYMYGPEIAFRAQPYGTLRFLFNPMIGPK